MKEKSKQQALRIKLSQEMAGCDIDEVLQTYKTEISQAEVAADERA